MRSRLIRSTSSAVIARSLLSPSSSNALMGRCTMDGGAQRCTRTPVLPSSAGARAARRRSPAPRGSMEEVAPREHDPAVVVHVDLLAVAHLDAELGPHVAHARGDV